VAVTVHGALGSTAVTVICARPVALVVAEAAESVAEPVEVKVTDNSRRAGHCSR